ncbi:MAG: hypothetical protein ACI9WU_002451, partial [Myxococcota bacterium]
MIPVLGILLVAAIGAAGWLFGQKGTLATKVGELEKSSVSATAAASKADSRVTELEKKLNKSKEAAAGKSAVDTELAAKLEKLEGDNR